MPLSPSRSVPNITAEKKHKFHATMSTRGCGRASGSPFQVSSREPLGYGGRTRRFGLHVENVNVNANVSVNQVNIGDERGAQASLNNTTHPATLLSMDASGTGLSRLFVNHEAIADSISQLGFRGSDSVVQVFVVFRAIPYTVDVRPNEAVHVLLQRFAEECLVKKLRLPVSFVRRCWLTMAGSRLALGDLVVEVCGSAIKGATFHCEFGGLLGGADDESRKRPHGAAGGAGAGGAGAGGEMDESVDQEAKRFEGDADRDKELVSSVSFWEGRVRELAGGDPIEVAEAEIKQYDAEAKLAKHRKDKDGEAKAEMNKAEAKMNKTEAKMNKAKAEMNKAKAEMNKAKAEMNKAKADGDMDGHARATTEYDDAKRIHGLLLKQIEAMLVTQGGDNGSKGWHCPRIHTFVKELDQIQRTPVASTHDNISFEGAVLGGSWCIDPHGDGLFERTCFAMLQQKVENAWKETWTKNVLLRGTPGTGKTCFLQYMAWRILSQPRDHHVVLDTNDEVALICPDNTIVAGDASRGALYFAEQLNNPETCLLFDCGESARPPPSQVAAKVLAASSPNQTRYNEYLKKCCKELFMPLWSEGELSLCRLHCFNSKVSPELFLENYSWWGGVARNTIGDGAQQSAQRCRDALDTLDLNLSLEVLGKTSGLDPVVGGARVKHSISHLQIDDDLERWQFCFASQRVCDYILDRKADRAEQDCRDFLATHTDSVHSALRGQIFESYAHRTLAKGGQFSLRNLKDNSTENFNLPPRPLTRFDNLKEAVASTLFKDAYWVPNAKNFPVIDALMGDDGFQMTVSTDHGCVSSQMEKIKMDWPGFQRIVFVVPTNMAATYPQQKFTTQGGKECKTPPLSIRDIPQFVLGLDLSSTT